MENNENKTNEDKLIDIIYSQQKLIDLSNKKIEQLEDNLNSLHNYIQQQQTDQEEEEDPSDYHDPDLPPPLSF